MTDIRCLCLDVDGVLTDGGILIDSEGRSLHTFNVLDGFAIRWFQRLCGPIVIVTGRRSVDVEHRARELKIAHVVQGSEDKLRDLRASLEIVGEALSACAVVADDLPDLPMLRACGFPIAVANACDEIKDAARYVTRRGGGCGAVREAIELLMRRDGTWTRVVEHYRCQSGPGGERGTPTSESMARGAARTAEGA